LDTERQRQLQKAAVYAAKLDSLRGEVLNERLNYLAITNNDIILLDGSLNR
jgi:hypothetical protein